MTLHELTAANTLFKPKRKSALRTFLQTKRDDNDVHSDLGEYVRARVVLTKYHNNWIGGGVEALHCENGVQKWTVRFHDNYVRQYNRKELKDILVRDKRDKIGT